MRVVIYGIGTTGTKLVQTLYKEGEDIIIIDTDKQRIEDIQRRLDVLCVVGDMGDSSVIEEAKIRDADAFIAVRDSDEENIVACIIAKRHKVKVTIARLRNPSYLDKEILNANELGIDFIINPEKEVAKEIFKLITAPWAMDVDTFMRGKISLFEIKVNQSNIDYLNQKLKLISETNPILIINPGGAEDNFRFFGKDSVLNINECAYLLGKTEESEKINAIFEDVHPKINNVMMIGGGKTAIELLSLLEGTNIKVKLIEFSKGTCNMLSERFKKCLVLCGDATDLDLLMSENIDKVDCFIAITGDDEGNLMMSLFAKQKGVKKTITKVAKPYGKDMLAGIGIYEAVDVYKITVNKILSLISRREVISFSTLYNGVEMMEFAVSPNSKISDKVLKEPQIMRGAVIVAVYSKGDIIFPKGPLKVEPDNRVLLFANKKAGSAVEKYFRP